LLQQYCYLPKKRTYQLSEISFNQSTKIIH
jgi:hypothetical protein